MNYRVNIIKNNIDICYANLERLDGYEKDFLSAVSKKSEEEIAKMTTGQFNFLNELANSIKKPLGASASNKDNMGSIKNTQKYTY